MSLNSKRQQQMMKS